MTAASPPPVDLDQIETTLAAATPGRWVLDREYRGDILRDVDWSGIAECDEPSDAAAIVAAVNAVSAMAAELRTLRATVAAVEALAARWEQADWAAARVAAKDLRYFLRSGS